MPERIQMSRQSPWRYKYPDAVIVARPSKWGNPFRVGMVVDRAALTTIPDRVTTIHEVHVETHWQAVQIYRRWLAGTPYLVGGHDLAPHPPTAEQIRTHLAGRDLACWCPVSSICHADVLLELANA